MGLSVTVPVMPRRAAFIPTKTKDPKRGIPRRLPWMLNVPPALSETGKRQQKFFATQREAQTAAEQLKIRRDNFGLTLTLLSASRISEASEAYQVLDELGEPNTPLLSVVREYVEKRKQTRASVTFYKLFAEYVIAHSRVTRSHVKKLENARDRFPRVKEKPASEIQPGDLEPILNALPPAMRNAQMRYLKAVFNFGIKRGWVFNNPIERLDFVHLKAKEVETVSLGVVKKMLEGALANDLELVPFLTLGFFCGIRPKGELERLEWRSIDLKDKVIVISPERQQNPPKAICGPFGQCHGLAQCLYSQGWFNDR
jgi:integrase